MKNKKTNTGLIVFFVILIMLVLFLFCLFFLYKEGYLSLSKDDNDITITDKKEEKSDSNKISMKDIYRDLRNGKRTITTQNGAYSLEDYLSGKAFNLSILYSPEKYAYIDLDKDGMDELVVKLSKTDDYAIIHYEDNVVYALSLA